MVRATEADYVQIYLKFIKRSSEKYEFKLLKELSQKFVFNLAKCEHIREQISNAIQLLGKSL